MTLPPDTARAAATQPPARETAATLDIIQALLGPLAGRAILDVGCGGGALAAALMRRGAIVTGIDPLAEAIDDAARRVPQAHFDVAGAEAIPFADASFDAVVFLNSLHHVPKHLMGNALREAVRVSRGPVLVIEPLAEGPFFLSMQPVEDETQIRADAQDAITATVEEGALELVALREYDDARHFADVDAFLAKIVAVDPSRADIAARMRDPVSRLVALHGKWKDGVIALPQPHRAHLLERGIRAGIDERP